MLKYLMDTVQFTLHSRTSKPVGIYPISSLITKNNSQDIREAGVSQVAEFSDLRHKFLILRYRPGMIAPDVKLKSDPYSLLEFF